MEKKEKTGDQMCRRFAEHAQVRKIDEDERTIEFVASDSSVDSHGTVLPVEGWDLSRYEKNGVVKGSYLAGKRILRCNPFSKGGYDPVP